MKKLPIHPLAASGSIQRAVPADLRYVVDLSKRHTDAIGFVPRGAMEEKAALGRVWIVRENGEPAGFLYHGALGGPVVSIFQAAIQFDARRRKLAMAAVDRVAGVAAEAGAVGLRVACLSRLAANSFWEAAGFVRCGTRAGGARRGDTINLWLRSVGRSLFDEDAAERERRAM